MLLIEGKKTISVEPNRDFGAWPSTGTAWSVTELALRVTRGREAARTMNSERKLNERLKGKKAKT